MVSSSTVYIIIYRVRVSTCYFPQAQVTIASCMPEKHWHDHIISL